MIRITSKGIALLSAMLFAAPVQQRDEGLAGILAALRLPALVNEARGAGVTEATLRSVLDALLRRGLPSEDAALVLREEIDAVHAGAKPSNFGGFVQAQLDAGFRGRGLADAIRAEHQRMGIGRSGAGGHPEKDTAKAGGRKR